MIALQYYQRCGRKEAVDNDSGTPPPSAARADAQKPPGSVRLKRAGFVVLMLALTMVFVAFGTLHLVKLAEKQRLTAIIDARVKDPPIALPPVAEWVGFDPEIYDFRPLVVSGTFDSGGAVLVSARLLKARGSFSGPGYWVMVPLYLEGGGIVFINRGFVPEQYTAQFKQGGVLAKGPVTITGLGRISEKLTSFTPGTNFYDRIEWVRNIARLTQFIDAPGTPVAPIYIDAKPAQPGALPQGGETRLSLAGRHFEYALVWFFLALVTPVILLIRLFSQRQKIA